MTTASALDRLIQFPNRAAWLAGRAAHGMGGSDIARALGRSKFGSAHSLWRVLTKRATPDIGDGKPWLAWGQTMEDPILTSFEQRLMPAGLALRRCSLAILPHPTEARLFVSPDALLIQDGVAVAGADAKNVMVHQARGYGVPGTDEVPPDVLLQCVASCAAADVDRWYVVAAIGGAPPVSYVVHRDLELEEMVLGEALRWHDAHVLSDVAPDITDVDEASDAVAERWPTHDKRMLAPTLQTATTMRAWLNARLVEKAAKQEATRLATQLQDVIGTARGIKGLCSWTRSKDGTNLNQVAVSIDLAAQLRALIGGEAADAAVAALIQKYTSPVLGTRSFHAARQDLDQSLHETEFLIASLSSAQPQESFT